MFSKSTSHGISFFGVSYFHFASTDGIGNCLFTKFLFETLFYCLKILALDVRDADFYSGEPKNGIKADVVYCMSGEDFVSLISGKLNLSKAYLSKKIRLQGNVSFAFKLVNYFSLVDPNIDLNQTNKADR